MTLYPEHNTVYSALKAKMGATQCGLLSAVRCTIKLQDSGQRVHYHTCVYRVLYKNSRIINLCNKSYAVKCHWSKFF